MKLLEIDSLTHRFPDGTEAIKDITFSINSGDFLVISGKNGSGKSVLMHHLNGLLRPTSGKVLFKEKPIFNDILAVRQKIGIVFQNSNSQIVSQTVEMDVSFGPENLRLGKEEINRRVSEALKNTGLDNKRNHLTRSLSGGEKKRLAISGVLAMEPEIIILDEPFSNLDFPGVQMILRQIIRLNNKGHTIICITHELEKMLAHADRLIIMNEGRIVCDDLPEKALLYAPKFGIHIPGDPEKESPEKIVKRMTWIE